MDFINELRKYKPKEDDFILNDNNEMNQIEKTIKHEIRKSNLILQGKLEEVQKQIQEINLENASLKKENYRKNIEIKKNEELVINIINNFLGISDVTQMNLAIKRLKSLVEKENFKETAQIGCRFDSKYHEAINNVEEKKEYIVKEIIEQGYIREGNIIKIARVIIE